MASASTKQSPVPAISVVVGGNEQCVPVEASSAGPYVKTADFPFRVLDPHYYNTAACSSSVSRADAEEGKLYLRGFDMEELSEKSDFLEVAYLLIYGRGLPDKSELETWRLQVLSHTYLHEDIREQLRTFRYDAHPMGMMISTLAALSTFHPEANPSLQGPDLYQRNEETCDKQIFRILGKVTTTAACAYRVRLGRPFNVPEPAEETTYTENLLAMLDRLSEPSYRPNAQLARLLDKLFIALIDDGMNSATGMLRHVASSKVDPYSAIAAAAAAAYGARISGVGDAVLMMLTEIGSPSQAAEFVRKAKQTKRRLQGFGHLNYRAYDPRCRVVKSIALEVASLMTRDPLLDVALALEDQVVKDSFFTSRRVFPNVDLYLSLVFRMMGFPPDYFSVLITIPRTAGWLAHWREGIKDGSGRIARPRQIYTGAEERSYVGIQDRTWPVTAERPELSGTETRSNARRKLANT